MKARLLLFDEEKMGLVGLGYVNRMDCCYADVAADSHVAVFEAVVVVVVAADVVVAAVVVVASMSMTTMKMTTSTFVVDFDVVVKID